MPHGGFGNLIALPLQGGPRKSCNSVFVDTDLNPFADQWAYLSQLGRVPASKAESLVREAEKDGRVLGVKAVERDELLASAPWKAPPSRRPRDPPVTGPLPEAVEIVLGDGIYIAKQDLPPGIVTRLMRLAAFQNPELYRAQAMRLPNYGTPRIVDYVEDGPKFIRLPRGCLDDVRHLLRRFGIKPSIDDQRCPGTPVSVSFQGDLRPEQQMAASAMLTHDTGILVARMASTRPCSCTAAPSGIAWTPGSKRPAGPSPTRCWFDRPAFACPASPITTPASSISAFASI